MEKVPKEQIIRVIYNLASYFDIVEPTRYQQIVLILDLNFNIHRRKSRV